MVPTSLLGILTFVSLLAPGLAYVLRHEKTVPARSHSAFREGLRVIFVSIACLSAAGLLLSIARAIFPRTTPNVGLLVRNRPLAIRNDYVAYAWWAVALVAVAVGLGAVAADRRVVRRLQELRRRRPVRWITGEATTTIRSESAWYKVMNFYEDDRGPIYVGAQLDDGTYIEGYQHSFNVWVEETKDRDMLLSAPLLLTTVDGVKHDLEAQFTVISASRIVRLDVTHLPPSGAAEVPSPDASEGREPGH